MPRYFQTTGDTSHDREIDELWRLYTALIQRVAILEAAGATSSTVSGNTNSGASPGQSGASTVIVVKPPVAGSMAKKSGPYDPYRGWNYGGYVAEGDTVHVAAFGELEEELVIDGVLLIDPPACPATLAGAFDAVTSSARLSVPELPE